MKSYVVGFVYTPTFSTKGLEVLLIRKMKPPWQVGALNGVGGLIEPGEFPAAAMQREFKEETDCLVPAELWRRFCKLRVNNPDKEGEVELYFFSYFAKRGKLPVKAMTEEPLFWIYTDTINQCYTIDNLNWLVPMGCAKCPVELTGREK